MYDNDFENSPFCQAFHAIHIAMHHTDCLPKGRSTDAARKALESAYRHFIVQTNRMKLTDAQKDMLPPLDFL